MEEIFAICFVVILFWFIPGLACACFMKDCIFDDFNPLWKIPLTLIGPFSFVIVIFVGIYKLINNYVKEVKDYYERKSLMKPRKNKFKRSVRYEGEECTERN